MEENKKMETYLVVGDDEVGYVEFDLVSLREKGVEDRYLVVKLRNVDNTTEPPKEFEFFVSLDSEDYFNKIKEFFQKLEWRA